MAKATNKSTAPINADFIIEGTNDKKTSETLKAKIGQLATRKNYPFYIGKACGSNPPIKRWYNKYKKMGYDTMYVLCMTKTEQEALDLEDMIISYYNLPRVIKRQQLAKKGKVIRDDGTIDSNEGVSTAELERFVQLIDNKTGGGGGRHGSGCGFVYLVVKEPLE